MNCRCFNWCSCCGEEPVRSPGLVCDHCVVEDAVDAGKLTREEAKYEHSRRRADGEFAEGYFHNCPGCEGGHGCNDLCESCAWAEDRAEAEHRSAHSASRLG